MDRISESVVKRDHEEKITGRAVYVSDLEIPGVLTGKLLRSQRAKAGLLEVRLPSLPEGYYYIDRKDVPGENAVSIVLKDTPVYARETVEYVGEPIGMFCGPDPKVTERLRDETQVIYQDMEPVLDLRRADTDFYSCQFEKGDLERAFREADKVYEEEFETGYQEQAYLETQGLVAEPLEGGRIYIHGSMQCPYYVKGAVAGALALEPDKVRVAQEATGGGFGGKEAFPSILACQAAVAAMKTGKPVRLVFDRREDMEFTSKRHPSLNRYRAAVKDGRVTALDIDVKFNAGAYSTLSIVVLQRGVICANGVYNIENLRVKGRAMKTNMTPSGAYRGFGGPQTFFSVEMLMNHMARDLGADSLTFKEAHLVKQGDRTSTQGLYHFPVPLPEMIARADRACGFRRKHKEYAAPQKGRYRRGIGLSLCFHGAGFTGSGERELIKATVKLHKFPDGSVRILCSNADMGQGLRTTFPKIVAAELGLPLERVSYEYPDLDQVPDSGPTVASRSLMVVGELLRRAAVRLREQWAEGRDQVIEEHYEEPDFVDSFDIDKFQGDAYPTYSWSVTVVEVTADTLTGQTSVENVYGCFDVGTPVDTNIVLGQMEGGLLQGIGYSSMEKLSSGADGRLRNCSFADYAIPTAMDVPRLQASLYTDEKYPYGPYGAKGAGEIPLVGVPAAYLEAVEQALGPEACLRHIPFTAEDVIKTLEEAVK